MAHITPLLHDRATPEQQQAESSARLVAACLVLITMNFYDEAVWEEKRNAHRGVIQY
jgi:hypothetical protein